MAPQVVGVLTRRFGDFDAAEDAVQEALLDATAQWPEQGLPDNPRGRLIQVASRRMAERLRGEQARRRREERAAAQTPPDRWTAPPADDPHRTDRDERMRHRADTRGRLSRPTPHPPRPTSGAGAISSYGRRHRPGR
ncbi:sigma factor [Streptosporangium sp. NPDC006007]|uniref:sigma factor n=1 Tax=Streptosporangium sp. NPDC006007 TaxID=3154575 RepID=UPI0033B64BD4